MFPLRARIRQSLSNPVLQAALDANAERRLRGRAQAFASLPDAETRRQEAHTVRAWVIEHLDEVLERFLTRLQENGIHVHRAQNADEARRIVMDILSAYAAGKKGLLIAKSKSMVSEEIELNHALEAAGHRVVETDLGEYIVQLRGERPAHIITPAVHLRRQEVGALFHEKLGIPYTEEIAALTQAARRTLRQVFLQADVGISGVNFGVAESGALCILTNEGNGRMVTTLPRLHIALMGMERLVPDLQALELMLSLLPRSATGQKLTVYTQLIRAPLAGQERHLVLLDNGRTALRESPLEEALYCIRCGACLNACPAFREMGGHAYGSVYPGPIGSVISPVFFGAEFSALAYACSLCGACEEVCPVKIPLPELLIRVRAGQASTPISRAPSLPRHEQEGASLSFWVKMGLRFYTWLATHPRAFQLAQAWFASGFGGTGGLRLPQSSGWGEGRFFPRPARRSFHDLWQHAQIQAEADSTAPTSRSLSDSAGQAAQVEGEARRAAATLRPAGGPSLSPLERFCQEWQALGGEVVQVKGDLTDALLGWLKENGIEALYLAETPIGVDAEKLRQAGVHLGQEADLLAGLTGVVAAVAETGSLVITAKERAQAAASLLPSIHLAILRPEQIFPTLRDTLTRPELLQGSTAVLISGPSRTADIEMTLTIGVHGPGRTVVFVGD